MEHVNALSLLVITCLQLCRAELSGTWYSANVINDGDFSPKPISEIFTTGPPFSTANPIVVLPSSTSSPSGVSTSMSSTFSTAADYVSSTLSSRSSEVSFEPRTTQFIQPQSPTEPNDQSQQFQFPKQGFQQQANSQQYPPNYFLIYQQAPQTIQNNPPSEPQQSLPTFQPTPSSTLQPELSSQQTFSTFQQELSTPQTTFSTFQSSPELGLSTFQSNPSSTIQPELSTPQSTLSSFRPSTESTFPSTFDSTLSVTTLSPETLRTTRATVPCNSPSGQPLTNPADPLAKFPTLRIRMVAPSGSITNINVNPTVSTTTRRTTRSTTRRTTTTRRPTTTRTRRTRRNRNSFDGCINACTGRAPICASPLAVTPIDPDRLKGFPSICHMACHNSFRRDQYEMLVDGRCGRLRTRIRPVDSDGKLKRVELNKAQYTIVDNPQTVVEFSSLPR